MTTIDQLTQDLATAQSEIKELHEYDLAQKSKLITATHNLTEAQAEIARLNLKLECISNGVPRAHIENGLQCKHNQYGYENCDACYQEYAEQALSQSSPSLALQGWKLVPIEPTTEMLLAGQDTGIFSVSSQWTEQLPTIRAALDKAIELTKGELK